MNYSETSWSSFYSDRVNNSSYLDKFYNKYKQLIDFIDKQIEINPDIIIKEEGCGIGNVSKAHYFNGKFKPKKYIFSDIDSSMLELTKINSSGINVPMEYINEDILKQKHYEENTLIVTHGVLEHFSDLEIKKIIENQKHKNVIASCHYVPLEGYYKPSFGDERLFSASKWIMLVGHYTEINIINNQDLFIFNVSNI